jgi:hypothetical protein
MTIKGSAVTSNTALTDSSGDQGGGGGIANLNITPLTGAPDSGVLTLTGSRVSGNSAAGLGGGIPPPRPSATSPRRSPPRRR